jgi:hypothetical protein
MKQTFAVLFLGVGLFSIPFSSCSTTSTSSAGTSLAIHDTRRAADIKDANNSSDSPDTFGNPLVEF